MGLSNKNLFLGYASCPMEVGKVGMEEEKLGESSICLGSRLTRAASANSGV